MSGWGPVATVRPSTFTYFTSARVPSRTPTPTARFATRATVTVSPGRATSAAAARSSRRTNPGRPIGGGAARAAAGSAAVPQR